eukprot:CAMPEP_0185506984 /NCGR_PEP_ID=MMETSP1366-20130426/40872_1 /TAXON_ID=38817 /ORGANISM="Gephyrocapsa oceanica, Strain RCC1303" /LENGTH=68 /DNA_ID=CAMNT_0028117209 /DNA_START=265 /DNA_END=471 /DNA_ORIENTATION=-
MRMHCACAGGSSSDGTGRDGNPCEEGQVPARSRWQLHRWRRSHDAGASRAGVARCIGRSHAVFVAALR